MIQNGTPPGDGADPRKQFLDLTVATFSQARTIEAFIMGMNGFLEPDISALIESDPIYFRPIGEAMGATVRDHFLTPPNIQFTPDLLILPPRFARLGWRLSLDPVWTKVHNALLSVIGRAGFSHLDQRHFHTALLLLEGLVEGSASALDKFHMRLCRVPGEAQLEMRLPEVGDDLVRLGWFPDAGRLPALYGAAALGREDRLYAFYDLEVSPVSFDFVGFLTMAEVERKALGLESIHVVIVPGKEGFRQGDSRPLEQLELRLKNIVLPMARFLPSNVNLTVCAGREEARLLEAFTARRIFPYGYRVAEPKSCYMCGEMVRLHKEGHHLPSLRAPADARGFIAQWLRDVARDRKVVTITLRESSLEPARNSLLAEWVRFAKGLDPEVYLPVFIRDTEASLKPVPRALQGLTLFPEIPWNLDLRLALYELSFLNLGTNNGPFGMTDLCPQVRYLMFKVIVSGGIVTSLRFHEEQGVSVGESLPFSGPFQKWVWEDDRYPAIQREFEAMAARLEVHDAELRETSRRTEADAERLADAGRLEEGLTRAEAALAEDSNNPSLLHLKARLLHRMDRLAEAKGVLVELIQLAPEHWEGYYLLGRICRETGEWFNALRYLEAAWRIDPLQRDRALEYAKALAETNNKPEARKAVTLCLSHREDPELRAFLGELEG